MQRPAVSGGAVLSRVMAIGQADYLKADMIRPGAVVIDVGMNRRADNTWTGDVDYPAVSQVASAITPVPGGVGQMTVACLLVNTLRAACAIHGLPKPGV